MIYPPHNSTVSRESSPFVEGSRSASVSPPSCPETPGGSETDLKEWNAVYLAMPKSQCEENAHSLAKTRELLKQEIEEFANLFPKIPLQPILNELTDTWIHQHEKTTPYDLLQSIISHFPDLSGHLEGFLSGNDNILSLVCYNHSFKQQYEGALLLAYHLHQTLPREELPSILPWVDQTSGLLLCSLQAFMSALNLSTTHFPDLKKLAATEHLRTLYARLVQIILAGEGALGSPLPASSCAFQLRELDEIEPTPIPIDPSLLADLEEKGGKKLWELCLKNWNRSNLKWQIGCASFHAGNATNLERFIETVIEGHQFSMQSSEGEQGEEWVPENNELTEFLNEKLPNDDPASRWIKRKTEATLRASNLPFLDYAQAELAKQLDGPTTLVSKVLSASIFFPFEELNRIEACVHFQLLTEESDVIGEVDVHMAIPHCEKADLPAWLYLSHLQFCPLAPLKAIKATLNKLFPGVDCSPIEEGPESTNGSSLLLTTASNIYSYVTSYLKWPSLR